MSRKFLQGSKFRFLEVGLYSGPALSELHNLIDSWNDLEDSAIFYLTKLPYIGRNGSLIGEILPCLCLHRRPIAFRSSTLSGAPSTSVWVNRHLGWRRLRTRCWSI